MVQVIDRKATSYEAGLIAGRFSGQPEVLDNNIVCLYDFQRLDGPAAKAVEAEVVKLLKVWWPY